MHEHSLLVILGATYNPGRLSLRCCLHISSVSAVSKSKSFNFTFTIVAVFKNLICQAGDALLCDLAFSFMLALNYYLIAESLPNKTHPLMHDQSYTRKFQTPLKKVRKCRTDTAAIQRRFKIVRFSNTLLELDGDFTSFFSSTLHFRKLISRATFLGRGDYFPHPSNSKYGA